MKAKFVFLMKGRESLAVEEFFTKSPNTQAGNMV